jgi:hypothetical protein
MYYKKDNARFLKVPILFSQHEHRTLTGQKLYFKRVLPLFSRPYIQSHTKSCLKSIGEKGWGMGDGGWGMGDGGETIHNWVFKVRSAVNHRIKNGFSISIHPIAKSEGLLLTLS